MTTRFKKGKGATKIGGIKPEAIIAMLIGSEVFVQFGRDCIFTGGTEEGHKTIIHPLGYACDFRTRHLSKVELNEIAQEIAQRLTDEYDVLIKDNPPHIHVEFDPR